MLHKRLRAFGLKYQLGAVNFAVGAIVLTLELTASRIVAPYIGLTIYVWTSIIGIILAALALGYLFGGRLADKRQEPLDVVYILLFSAIVIGVVNFGKDPLLNNLSLIRIPLQLQALTASCVLFAPPTFLLGCVSPYLARLNISSVATSGTQISSISAAGTFGSLFGTFFTGFFLFSLIGTRNIMTLLVFLLIGTSFSLVVNKYNKGRVFLIAVALLFLLVPSHLDITAVSKDFDTAYSRYMIRDFGSVRVLQGDSLAVQSAVFTNAYDIPVFPYIKAFDAVSKLAPQQSSYLVIGGGAFTLPNILIHEYPHADIDVAEIDSALVPISERYFGLQPVSNLHVFAVDGREYLNNNRRHYGMIYVDAYSDSTPPFQLMTWQAAGQMRSSLTPGGVVAVNIFAKPEGSGAPYVASIAKTFQHAFTHVLLLRVDQSLTVQASQNIILLASQKPLQPVLRSLSLKNSIVGTLIKNRLTYKHSEGLLLSDDFAPVDQMVANQE